MKTLIKLFLITILISTGYSCKKNQVGGKGSLKGMIMHHNKPIADAYVYIKYNSTEFPGEEYTLYDTYVQADAGGNYKIPLYKGTYYVFATGRDEDIPSPYTVKGGFSFSLKNKENISKDIQVSED